MATIFCGTMMGSVMAYIALDHNPQGEYCEVVAYAFPSPSIHYERALPVYVNIQGCYVAYDAVRDASLSTFYHATGDIHKANWASQGNPCVILNAAWRLWAFFVIIGLLVLGVCMFALLSQIPNFQK